MLLCPLEGSITIQEKASKVRFIFLQNMCNGKTCCGFISFFSFLISCLPRGRCFAQTRSYVPLGTNVTEKKLDQLMPENYIVPNPYVSCMTLATEFQEIIP